MKIAPIDIAHKSFSRKLAGYDTDEVARFLTAVSEELEALIRERNQLKETLREKELNIIEYRERDQLLKDTITTAHKMAETIRADAEREARLILNDANQKAELIAKDARDSLKKIYQEISDLKRVRLSFDARLRSLLQTYLTILDDEKKGLENLAPQADTKQGVTL